MSRFNPYEDNGGTTLAVAGNDYVVVGADTRVSRGYSILSRKETKWKRLTSNTLVISSGQKSDMDYLFTELQLLVADYEFAHNRSPSTKALSQLVSTVLYQRRFFPIYAFIVLVGLDDEGRGQVYGYDAIGSFTESKYAVQGTAMMLVMPVLDAGYMKDMPLEEAKELVLKSMRTANERDIHTGDVANVLVLTSSGLEEFDHAMRKD